MAEVGGADGSVLTVRPVPVLDRDGVVYEVTLELLRDGVAFGAVGERCGYFLASTAARLRAAGPDFPASSVEAGLRAYAADEGLEPELLWRTLQRYLPRDRELFCFRSRDPDDLGTAGVLRVTLEEQRRWWPAGQGLPGSWRIDCHAVLEAWGTAGVGVRAVLSSQELLGFLTRLVAEFAAVGAVYDQSEDAAALRRPVG